MKELEDITRSITHAVTALKAKIEQAGFKVTMPEEPGTENKVYETKNIPAPFSQANTAVTLNTVVEGSPDDLKLMGILETHKSDRDGFCKAAKGAVFGMKADELRQYYSEKRKAGMANGTWPKPLTPTQRKQLEAKPNIEAIIAEQANGLTAQPEPEKVPETVNGFTAPSIPTAEIPTFNDQVQAIRTAEIEKAMDPELAKIEGQVGQDAAGDKHNSLLQLARTTARALGANGPISIDEVTAAMAASSNVMPVEGKAHKWKGKVFNSSEWVWVGTKATSMVSSHARHVGVWALKAWLKDNTLNGTAASVSSYNLFGIYKDMCRLNTTRIKVEAEKFSWFIGDETLSAELRANITKDNNCLYGIPVSFIPGAVGAMLLPPDPSRNMARVEK